MDKVKIVLLWAAAIILAATIGINIYTLKLDAELDAIIGQMKKIENR